MGNSALPLSNQPWHVSVVCEWLCSQSTSYSIILTHPSRDMVSNVGLNSLLSFWACLDREMAKFSPPETFDFSRPIAWPEWKERFLRFRSATKLNKEVGEVQVSSLIYAMGREADNISKPVNTGEPWSQKRWVYQFSKKQRGEYSYFFDFIVLLCLILIIYTGKFCQKSRNGYQNIDWKPQQNNWPKIAEWFRVHTCSFWLSVWSFADSLAVSQCTWSELDVHWLILSMEDSVNCVDFIDIINLEAFSFPEFWQL